MLVAGACAREPAAPRYHVTARLVEHLRNPAKGSVGDDCPLADQRRAALGCTTWDPRATVVVAEPRAATTIVFPARRTERRKPIVLKADWWFRGAGVHAAATPLSALADDRLVRVTIPDFPPADAPAGSTVRLWSRPLPPQVYRTTGVAVAPGAKLSFAIGLDAGSTQPTVASIEFVVFAHAGRVSREIFRAAIEPGTAAAAEWQEHTVALDAVVGPATTFRFVTWIHPKAGADRRRALAVPLWGAPEVLAPSLNDLRPNVILVSLDTLRGDHVGALGSELPLTPRIDALAAAGVVFENAMTTFPSTTGAHLSMMTGLYPIRTGIVDPRRRLPASVRTLAEVIGAAGWRTAAVTEAAMLAARVGFSRGFSRYRENLEKEPEAPPSYKPAHTFDAALSWLEEARDDRFFLFVHTYAVHYPYAAPVEYQFQTWKDGDVERPLSEAPFRVALRHRYAADVRYADAQVGRLVDAVRRLGLERQTIVVVTSDHGEAFNEHGYMGHGQGPHDEVMHIPLLLWGPGQLPAGRRIRTPVSLVDLVPTILQLAGVAVPPDLDGQSQAARIEGGPEEPERAVFASLPLIRRVHGGQTVARTATTKWVASAGTSPNVVAYDLVADPHERSPLRDAELLARGGELIGRYKNLAAKATEAIAVPLSDDTKEQLRALGYLE